MELNDFSLYFIRSKFVLSAVIPELRSYDVVDRAVNHELRNYYIDVCDLCPTVVYRTVVQY